MWEQIIIEDALILTQIKNDRNNKESKITFIVLLIYSISYNNYEIATLIRVKLKQFLKKNTVQKWNIQIYW